VTALHPDIERVALLGWHLYPASRSITKKACFRGATDRATCHLDTLESWAKQFPNCNWRVVCGPSRIWGLDLDSKETHEHDGVRAFTDLVKIHGPLPPRPQLRSGGGGLALFFNHTNERITGKTNYPAPGIDPRRERLSQTVPPSIHATTGKPYLWLVAPWEIAPPIAPAWLLRLVQPPPEPEHRAPEVNTTDGARYRLYRAATAVAQAGQGERNDVLNRRSYQVGRMLAAGLLGEQEAIEALYAAARTAGLDHNEAKNTIRSGINSGMRRGADGR